MCSIYVAVFFSIKSKVYVKDMCSLKKKKRPKKEQKEQEESQN